ncbi:MAG: hypothetical protein GY789_30290 [Hyphomicrobiales bacterium]|nr:hypothetical protein [Hyphomicrobiales bacterium]MCP5000251.1 hypothetical protein [Hyphomicrobiales bacterium]
MNIATTRTLTDVETDPDYEVVRRALEFITGRYRSQPSLQEIAAELGRSPT